MSLILDALQRSRVSARSSSRHPSQADAVLATLGYSPKRGRATGSVRTLVYVGLAALLAAVVLWSRPYAGATSGSRRAATRKPACDAMAARASDFAGSTHVPGLAGGTRTAGACLSGFWRSTGSEGADRNAPSAARIRVARTARRGYAVRATGGCTSGRCRLARTAS
jgi:hypothetical protein